MILTIGFVFGAIVLFLQRSTNYICANIVAFDCPYYFPISIFTLRLPTSQDIVIISITVAVFFLFWQILEIKKYKLSLVILFSSLLIVGTNAAQGIDIGIYAPIAGDVQTGEIHPVSPYGKEYYHDALDITNWQEFLRNFNKNQTKLKDHSITHPPFAVLLFYFLEETVKNVALIALMLMFAAVSISVFFVYKLASTALDEENAKYVAFLFTLLPMVQIYYLTTIDALVISLLTATLYLFCFGKGAKSIAGAAITLCCSFFLTFVSLFILPVLVGYELIVKRTLRRSLIVIGNLVAVHVLLYVFFNYNAWKSFRTASRYENPYGFRLFVDPINYFFTRIENVAEILFFFTPFLTFLLIKATIFGWQKLDLKNHSIDSLWKAINDSKYFPQITITLLGVATLSAMFLTGAFRTGETARACGFIYPFLLLPVTIFLKKSEIAGKERLQLASLVFAQAVIMQTFGYYVW